MAQTMLTSSSCRRDVNIHLARGVRGRIKDTFQDEYDSCRLHEKMTCPLIMQRAHVKLSHVNDGKPSEKGSICMAVYFLLDFKPLILKVR